MASPPLRTLDLAEAAALRKVHPQILRRLARKGVVLSAAKVGRMAARLRGARAGKNETIIPGV